MNPGVYFAFTYVLIILSIVNGTQTIYPLFRSAQKKKKKKKSLPTSTKKITVHPLENYLSACLAN